MQTKTNTYKIVLTALMMCLIMISILFLRIPIPFTQGYVHLGDALVFFSVLLLGWKYGALASALGGLLGDLVGGFAMWAPWSFAIKGIMALILGLAVTIVSRTETVTKAKYLAGEIAGMVSAGIVMVIGYYLAEGIMYGNWIVPVMGIPWNIGQFAVGMAAAVILAEALCRTPAKMYFAFRMPGKKQA